MRKIHYALAMAVLLLAGCDVHEWPENPETVTFHLKLDYHTDITLWPHLYDNGNMTELGIGPDTASVRSNGTMRYVIKAYNMGICTYEYIIYKNMADGYNNELTINLPAGNYNIMVWSDMQQNVAQPYFYNCSNFAEIALTGKYQGNNNWRDAFSGKGNINLVAECQNRLPDTLSISMERQLAKYEFITTDVMDFVKEETATADASMDLDNYTIEFRYVGFLPSAYSLFTGKNTDATTGVVFSSKIKDLSDSTALLGFDYVFANSNDQTVTLQLLIYDNNGRYLSVSEPIKVPLRRNYLTTVTGKFLTSMAKGGVIVNPYFDGNYNITFH